MIRDKYVIEYFDNSIPTNFSISPAFRCVLSEMDTANIAVIDKEKYKYYEKTYKIKEPLLRWTIQKAIKSNLMLRTGNTKYFINPFNFAKIKPSPRLERLRELYKKTESM